MIRQDLKIESWGTAPMFSTDDREALLLLARKSISWGFEYHAFLPIDPSEYPQILSEQGASFVTLKDKDVLRGCVGALKASQPLCVDVSEHAWAAAFSDRRFNRVEPDELKRLSISISVLGIPEPIQFSNEANLIGQLKPNQDGLILQEGSKYATFLPSVWESLPSPKTFLGHLKRKAGLTEDYWSESLEFSRYVTESFTDKDTPHSMD